MIKILVDCDPGIDDSVALLYALHKKGVEVVGISTSVGNVTAKQGARNALNLLKLAGREGEIPVCIGAEKPLVGECEEFPDYIHGINGFGDVELEASKQPPIVCDVCDFLYEKACEFENELVLVTLGRLTNIANTLKKYPDFAKKIKRVVMMGGSIDGYGNVAPMVEANFGGDPEAADIAICADWHVTIVGLNVTTKTILTMNDIKMAKTYCREECKKILQFIEDEMQCYMKGVRLQNWMRNACPVHDPLAMMVAINPSLVTTQHRVTRIECGGTYSRGMVVTDKREYPIDGPMVEHCVDVDGNRAINELFAVYQESIFE